MSEPEGPLPTAATARLTAVAIEGFQPSGSWATSDKVRLRAKGSGFNEGWLLNLS